MQDCGDCLGQCGVPAGHRSGGHCAAKPRRGLHSEYSRSRPCHFMPCVRAGITLASSVRRRPNCFNLLTQMRVLRKMGKSPDSGLEAGDREVSHVLTQILCVSMRGVESSVGARGGILHRCHGSQGGALPAAAGAGLRGAEAQRAREAWLGMSCSRSSAPAWRVCMRQLRAGSTPCRSSSRMTPSRPASSTKITWEAPAIPLARGLSIC